MKSKLLFIPFIALLLAGTSVNAQSTPQSKQAKEQAIDRYQQQKETIQASFKRDMDALNNQKNLTPAQRQSQKKQIIATYEQQKRANQQAFQNSKQTQKAITKVGKDADKMDDHDNNRMKDKHIVKAKKHNDNKHHGNKHRTTPRIKKSK